MELVGRQLAGCLERSARHRGRLSELADDLHQEQRVPEQARNELLGRFQLIGQPPAKRDG
jgi:hypothetical protein